MGRRFQAFAAFCIIVAVSSTGCSDDSTEPGDAGSDIADERDATDAVSGDVRADTDADHTDTGDAADADRWWRDYCEANPEAEQIIRLDSSEGQWSLALNREWRTALLRAPADSNITGVVGSRWLMPVGNAVIVEPWPDGMSHPREAFGAIEAVADDLDAIGEAGGESPLDFEAPGGFEAAAEVYFPSLSGQALANEYIRNRLVEAVVGADEAEFQSPLPDGSQIAFHDFRIYATTMRRVLSSGEEQLVTAFAVSSLEDYDTISSVEAAVDEIGNLTHISPTADGTTQRNCELFQHPDTTPVDAIFVVDASLESIRQVSDLKFAVTSFARRATDAQIDWRVSIVPMDPDALERTHVWRRDLVTAHQDIDDILANSDRSLRGLETVRRIGAEMAELEFDSNAQAMIILASASEDSELTGLSSGERAERVSSAVEGIGDANVFALVGGGDDCGGAREPAYEQLAEATSGRSGSLCLAGALFDDVFPSWSEVAWTRLSQVPVQGSLRVSTEDGDLTRSFDDGFRYLPGGNSLFISNNVFPERRPRGYIAVTYEFWAESGER